VTNYFERESHQDEVTLARNELDDAKSRYAADPSPQNLQAIRDAQDDINQAQSFRDANTFDLLGRSAIGVGAVLRHKGSEQGKQSALRERDDASTTYRQNPTLENWLKLQIASATANAWKSDVNADNNELLADITTGGAQTVGIFGQASAFQKSSSDYNRIQRLNRELVRVQQANALQNITTVAQRMLALSTYGAAANNVPFMSVQFERTN